MACCLNTVSFHLLIPFLIMYKWLIVCFGMVFYIDCFLWLSASVLARFAFYNLRNYNVCKYENNKDIKASETKDKVKQKSLGNEIW